MLTLLMELEFPTSGSLHRDQPFSSGSGRIRWRVHQGVEIISFVILWIGNFSEESPVFGVNSTVRYMVSFLNVGGYVPSFRRRDVQLSKGVIWQRFIVRVDLTCSERAMRRVKFTCFGGGTTLVTLIFVRVLTSRLIWGDRDCGENSRVFLGDILDGRFKSPPLD